MSKLFDFIHQRGIAVAENRAQAVHPDYKERYDARRVEPGIVLGTEGPGGLDGFFEDMKLAKRYRPWWHTISLRIHWWLQQYGPRATKANAVAFYQRGSRGWADRDIWNFDAYLARVIRDGCRHLNETKHGWPGEQNGVKSVEEWGQILNGISTGMQAHLDLMEFSEDHDYNILEAQRRLAFEHLTKYWGHLWD